MLYELHKMENRRDGRMGAKTCTAGLIGEGGRLCCDRKRVENQGTLGAKDSELIRLRLQCAETVQRSTIRRRPQGERRSKMVDKC